MTLSIGQEIKALFPSLTRGEKAVANAMLADLNGLAFRTAASLAETAGVSPMTVSRFLRTLGYNGLPELKEKIRAELEAAPLLVSERIGRVKPGGTDERLRENFELEMRCILSAYELRGTPAWAAALSALQSSRTVFVTGYQSVSGLASDFAARLDYIRPGVSVLDGRNGTFSELFMDAPETASLVLFEMRRYTGVSRLLADEARKRGVALVVICDSHCYWAYDYTETVLPIRTESQLFWDTTSAYSSLVGLLFDDLIALSGSEVATRTKHMRDLQDRFAMFRD